MHGPLEPAARRRRRCGPRGVDAGDVAVLEEDDVARPGHERDGIRRDEVLALRRGRARSAGPSARRRARRARGSRRRGPRRRRSAGATAARTAARRSPWKAASTSCAKTSVSVSLENVWPAFASAALRSAKFSKMPLWTTTILPVQSVCGWAFSSVGRPCVAQRVWPMPVDAGGRRAVQLLDEVGELARDAVDGEAPVRERRDARRVVAAVFEPLQALEQQRRRLPRTDVADDSAHGVMPRRGIRPTADGIRCHGRRILPALLRLAPRHPALVVDLRERGTARGRPSGTSSVIVVPAPT